jgi:tetratricopeptide (TPR) repeat protein
MRVGRYQDMLDIADTILAEQGGQNVEETYYYKGFALQFLGDISGAATAFERALQLNGNFYPAQIALDSIS